jgi:ABC-type phosphate transport system substrate-binding protein
MLLLPQGGATQDADFKVVVSPENEVASLARRDVARMFLKRTTNWPDGSAIVPVDQSSRSAVRVLFTGEVLKVEGLEKMSAVENYWQQQIFSGRGSPPPIKASDEEVVAFVAANPGAIGYVRGTADVSAVKTVALED